MTHSPPSLPAWRRALAPLLIVAILAAAAWRENRERPLDFWSHSAAYGDYVNICLAHALNIDFGLSKTSPGEGRDLNINNTLHPGLPLQATSWVAYRLTSPKNASDAKARCESVFTDPSSFWRASQLTAITMALLSSALLAWTASRHGILYSLAIGLFYFCYEPAWDYSIRLLGNESFALPLSLAVAWFAGKSLSSASGTTDLKWWAGWGAVCALCWLNKLNYIAWTAAVVPAGLIYYFTHRPAISSLLVRLFVFTGGFFVAAFGLTTLMLGSGGLGRILTLHFGVLTHSGSYGNGPSGAVSASAVQEAIHALAAYRPFLALSLTVCVWSLWVATRNAKVSDTRAAYLVYLVSTAVLFLAATLKHFGPHYLIAGVPAISLLVLAIGERIGARGRLVLTLAIGMALTLSYRRYTVLQDTNFHRENEIKASLQAVDTLAGRTDEGILWSYRLPHLRFVMELVQYLAGIPEVASVLDDKFPTSDSVYFLWVPEVRSGTKSIPFTEAKWRYAVFGRDYYKHFLKGEKAGARDYFEQHCRRIIDSPQITVFERSGK